jgi:superfamily II DNA/RNA helicase
MRFCVGVYSQDIVANSPTGSGKTLAFLVPAFIEAFARRHVIIITIILRMIMT